MFFKESVNLNFRFSEKATKVENEVEKLKEDSLDSIPFSKNSNLWLESLLEVIRQNIAE